MFSKISNLKKVSLFLGYHIILISLIVVFIFQGLNIQLNPNAFSFSIKDSASFVKNNILQANPDLPSDNAGRTNFLILGKDLGQTSRTDVMLVLSYYKVEQKFAMLSLPRDFFVFDGDNSYKLNSVYERYGKKFDKPEDGVADFVQKEWGLTLHSWVSFDFENFKNIINSVGGVTIDIPETFSDCSFPDDNPNDDNPCLTFYKGEELMSGSRALRYVRSRKSDTSSDQSCDAARNSRQSQVFLAAINAIADYIKIAREEGNRIKILNFGNELQKNFNSSTNISIFTGLTQEVSILNSDISNRIYRGVWTVDDEVFCQADDPEFVIAYCDGSYGGSSADSEFRTTAKTRMANLLEYIETQSSLASNLCQNIDASNLN
jgi:LCP family protein required for cell wall assembly